MAARDLSPSTEKATPKSAASEGSVAEWEVAATAAVEAVRVRMEPRLKEAGERLYEDLLYTVQDYLLDNVIYNVRQQIASADRQAALDRKRVSYLFTLLARVTGSLHDYAHAAGELDERDTAALLAEARAVNAWGDPGEGYGA